MSVHANRAELIPTRQTLLSRLKDWGDQESWKEFFETYWHLIYSTARRARLSDAEAQDVVQETVIAVCRHMPDFHYDPAVGSFKRWLLIQTGWRIADQLRKRKLGALAIAGFQDGRAVSLDELKELPDPGALEAFWDDGWERGLMEAAIERVKLQVNPKHFQAFDLNVLQDVPAGKVAKMLKLSVTQVYLAKHRISRAVQRETRKLQRQFEQVNEK